MKEGVAGRVVFIPFVFFHAARSSENHRALIDGMSAVVNYVGDVACDDIDKLVVG